MWIVYDKRSSWKQGYVVVSETEAIEICEEDADLTYCYIEEQLTA